MKEKTMAQNSYWHCTCFRIRGLHVPPNVSVSEVIYALGILFITLYVVFRALKYFKLI